jgi:hypothetical protein
VDDRSGAERVTSVTGLSSVRIQIVVPTQGTQTRAASTSIPGRSIPLYLVLVPVLTLETRPETHRLLVGLAKMQWPIWESACLAIIVIRARIDATRGYNTKLALRGPAAIGCLQASQSSCKKSLPLSVDLYTLTTPFFYLKSATLFACLAVEACSMKPFSNSEEVSPKARQLHDRSLFLAAWFDFGLLHIPVITLLQARPLEEMRPQLRPAPKRTLNGTGRSCTVVQIRKAFPRIWRVTEPQHRQHPLLPTAGWDVATPTAVRQVSSLRVVGHADGSCKCF